MKRFVSGLSFFFILISLFMLSNCKKEKKIELPTVITSPIQNITSHSASAGGEVTSDGGSAINARGICWNTSHNPTVSLTKANSGSTSNGTGIGAFTASITDLAPGTTYYVRAYATNIKGTVYGAEQSFTTTSVLSVLTTTDASDITSTSASSGGNITNDGGASITARGVCWSTSQNPTTADSKTTDGNGKGNFTSSITGLTPGTTYYIRAYATSSVGTAYGNQITIKTLAILPTLTTTESTTITSTSASSGGNITNDGGASITARGVCWSTSQNPTTADSKTTDGKGKGNFTSSITGLTPGTTYYIRAYATSSVGTVYGNQITITTLADLPELSTTEATSITSTSASSGGNITNDGGASITARGVCWSTSQNPTTADSKTTDGSGTGNFTSSITGLTSRTTYYIRAYATNSIGTVYGNQITITTLADLPELSTTEATSITSTSASSGGNITNDGGASITARGVCWSTSQNPTTADSKTTNGSGTGNFTSSITGLTPGTTYYIRAYATNSVGTAYGSQVSFRTSAVLPTVTTTSLSNVTVTSLTTGGNVVNDGGEAITARGVCYGTSPNPTIAGSKTTDGTGSGTFISSLTGLTAGVTYYIRAYATNSVGTAYGNEFRANGLTEEINNLVPESILDELKRLGMPINTGFTPPNVNGIYSMTQFILKNSNIPYDTPNGTRFTDIRLRIYEQNNTNLTIKYEDKNISPSTGEVVASSTGALGYIVGNGNLFTIFVKVIYTKPTGESADLVYVVSGEMSGLNVSNMHFANFMLDNKGNDYEFMSNGRGRVFYDLDGVSEKIDSLTPSHSPTKSSFGISVPTPSSSIK